MSRQEKSKRNSWFLFFIIAVPLGIIGFLAMEKFGFIRVFPVLVGILAIVLLHQRFVKGRSWNSILWGDRGSRS